jgi:hypothetical protein
VTVVHCVPSSSSGDLDNSLSACDDEILFGGGSSTSSICSDPASSSESRPKELGGISSASMDLKGSGEAVGRT